MLKFIVCTALAFAAVSPTMAQTQPIGMEPDTAGQLRLKQGPGVYDNYCLDVAGSGKNPRLDLPMTASTCKNGLYMDETIMVQDQKLFHPAYNTCVSAAGLNGRALAGASLLPRPCGEQPSADETEYLQRFTFHRDGKIELEDSGLCLTAGEAQDMAFSSQTRWRNLVLSNCKEVDMNVSSWVYEPKVSVTVSTMFENNANNPNNLQPNPRGEAHQVY